MSLARLDAEEEALMSQLPDFVTKLISGYRLKCFWFEIFECVRKLALVCMPVWFPAGSGAQLIFGIIVCFGTFGVYMLLNPYVSVGEDRLAQLCQTQIFLVLVLSLSLRQSQEDKSEAEEHNIDVALTVLIIAPIVMSVLLDFVVAKLLVSARMPLPPTRSTPPTDSQSRRSQPSPRKTLTLATRRSQPSPRTGGG